MRWWIAIPIATVFQVGFWVLLDLYRAIPGGSSLMSLDPAAFVGLAAGVFACWSGMVIYAWAA